MLAFGLSCCFLHTIGLASLQPGREDAAAALRQAQQRGPWSRKSGIHSCSRRSTSASLSFQSRSSVRHQPVLLGSTTTKRRRARSASSTAPPPAAIATGGPPGEPAARSAPGWPAILPGERRLKGLAKEQAGVDTAASTPSPRTDRDKCVHPVLLVDLVCTRSWAWAPLRMWCRTVIRRAALDRTGRASCNRACLLPVTAPATVVPLARAVVVEALLIAEELVPSSTVPRMRVVDARWANQPLPHDESGPS